MRKYKIWKILGTTFALGFVLLLLFVVAFIFNPFEGSLPDIRGLVPRDADYFVRKANLRDDFDEFPEPEFWSRFTASSSWETLSRGRLVRDAEGPGGIGAAVAGLRGAAAEIERQSQGFVSLLGDLIGEEVVLAGKLRPPTLDNAAFCAYLRVSWRIRAAWGLAQWTSVQSSIAASGTQVTSRDDGVLVLTPPDAPLFYVARHLDCLLISNDEDLLIRSLELTRGSSELESFAQSSHYRDDIRGRRLDWEAQTGIKANALELFTNAGRLFGVTAFDDEWPNPRHPDDVNERVLAAFVDLQGWRFFNGNLIFEPNPDSVTLIGSVTLNPSKPTRFQQEFFKAEPDEWRRWLDPFLSMVPATACAAAAIRMPAGDFLREMLAAIDPELRRAVDEQIRRTGQFDSAEDLLDQLGRSLHPRTGFVFQRAREIGGGIETFEPSPAPHVAWVFWIDKRFREQVLQIYEFLTRNYATLGFDQPLDLSVRGQGGDVAREFPNKNIPGTGEIAVMLYRDFFVVGNSGPLMSDMVNARIDMRSVKRNQDLQTFEKELAEKLNGFVWLDSIRLREVVDDYRRFLTDSARRPDAGWMVEVRPQIERDVLRRDFPQARSMAALTTAQREQLETAVLREMDTRWLGARDTAIAADRDSLDEAMGILQAFRSAFVEFRFEPNSLGFKARALMDFPAGR